MDCSTPGFPVHHQLSEVAKTHVHQVDDAIQPSSLRILPLARDPVHPTAEVPTTLAYCPFTHRGGVHKP